MMKRTSFFGVSLEGLVDLLGLQEPFNFSFFSITDRGIDLDYHDIEWFALEMKGDHSVVFETAPKHFRCFCRL